MKSWEAASLSSGSAVHIDVDPMVRTGSVTISGSRDVDRETARHLFEQHLSPLVHQNRTWLVGSARGIDQWALEWLREQNEICWAVGPYTMRDQPLWVQASLASRPVSVAAPLRR